MSSPIKREYSTKPKNSTSARVSHNLTFYKKDVEEFRPEQSSVSRLQTFQRKIAEGQAILANEVLRQRTVEDLEKKVEIVLRHNSHLLAENASLGELLAERNAELENLHEKLEAQMRGESNNLLWIEVEKKRLIEDFEKKHVEHSEEIRKLLDEISRLHEQCYEVENVKNMELQKLKENLEKDNYKQIQDLKRSQNGNIEIYETQIRTLKEALEQKNFETESFSHQNKMENDRLNEQIKHLQGELKHLKKIRVLEMDQCRVHYENELNTKLREAQRQQQLEANTKDSSLKKLKKELADKSIEMERLVNRLGSVSQQNEAELQILKGEKEHLRQEIDRLESQNRESLRQEREKLKKLNEMEIHNLEDARTNYANSLKSEVEKLTELNLAKSEELKTLYDQLHGLRDSTRQEIDAAKRLAEDLKKKLYELQLRAVEELELLKIKMAELHQGDVSSLRAFYENQLRIQAEAISALEKQLAESRGKVHKELQEKNELRKEFEIELSKEKAKNADLRVKLAALSVEMKEQMTSMNSKMELTSQTLLRQADLKQKGQAFHDEEKRKLHHLINAKDKEINDLRDQLDVNKRQRQAQSKALKSEMGELREFIKELESGQLKDRGVFEGQLKKREAKSLEEINTLKEEIHTLRNVDLNDLKAMVDKLQKENLKLQKDLQHSEREHKNVLVELGIRNGYVETIQLQSCAAIEDERNKVKVLMNKSEMGLRTYYEEKLSHKQKQLTALREQLIEKQCDIRDLITRYNELERKMAALLQSQEKLRDFENRVMNLGMDNNLVKNMAELFRARA